MARRDWWRLTHVVDGPGIAIRPVGVSVPARTWVVARGDLTDAQWARIRPLLEISAIGRLPRNLRAQVDGIIFKYRTGIQWRDLPERYGKGNTGYARFAKWRDDGTFERVFPALIAQAAARREG